MFPFSPSPCPATPQALRSIKNLPSKSSRWPPGGRRDRRRRRRRRSALRARSAASRRRRLHGENRRVHDQRAIQFAVDRLPAGIAERADAGQGARRRRRRAGHAAVFEGRLPLLRPARRGVAAASRSK